MLCVIVGLAGIGPGFLLCRGLCRVVSALPLHPKTGDTFWVFPTALFLSFPVTSAVATLLALRPSSEPELYITEVGVGETTVRSAGGARRTSALRTSGWTPRYSGLR